MIRVYFISTSVDHFEFPKYLCLILVTYPPNMACSILLLCTLSFLRISISSSQAVVPSPTADTEIICHTPNAAECYPRIFQPSNDFQIVHEDQAIPAGLHIRLNLETGRKEAKINVPDTTSTEESHDLVLVDVPDEQEEALDSQNVRDQTNPAKYQDLLGKHVDVAEASVYSASIESLLISTDDQTLFDKLEILEDLAHSSHWGLTLAKNKDVMRRVVEIFDNTSGSMRLRCSAALLLSTTLQNNLPALKAALEHFQSKYVGVPSGLLDHIFPVFTGNNDSLLWSRSITLLSGICYDEDTRCYFKRSRGVEQMISIFDAEKAGQDNKDTVRRKIANILSDHFLQYPQSTSQAIDSEETELHGEDPWTMVQDFSENLCSISVELSLEVEEMLSIALKSLQGKENNESIQARESIEQALAYIKARRV